MKCILIFDQLNDILYTKSDKKFLKHAYKIAKTQGLISENDLELSDPPKLSSNVIIQLFSPIITSQRLMTCQFGNSYTSIQCENGTNLVFNEYMGYLFVYISELPVEKLNRTLGICISLVKHLCGPNVPLLKNNKQTSMLLSLLLDTWLALQDSDQAVLVEAVEQLMVNNDLSSATLKALQEAVEKLQQQTDYTKIHALILVENKFLSLYSSRNAQDLIPADIIFLGLLTESLNLFPRESLIQSGTETEESEFEFPDSPGVSSTSTFAMNESRPSLTLENLTAEMSSHLVLLCGIHPHAVHIGRLADGVYLLLMFECGNNLVSVGLNDAFHSLNALQSMQTQKDIDGVRHAFEFLDSGMKKIFDGLKKLKNVKAIDQCQKNLQTKWDFMRKKYIEFIKNPDSELMMRIESSTTGFLDCLKLLLQLTCLDEKILNDHKTVIDAVHRNVKYRLKDFSDFLKVKALRNFTLGSRASLTINKYLEEFPGLVHFLYIDRHLHRLTAPSLDFNSEETTLLTKKKIWAMVDFARSHLQEGHLSMMWKDTTFNYAYFLWFEDTSGSPLKPKIYPTTVIKNFPPPGIIIDDFYKRLIEACFPKMSPSKVQCYELFCIHLGLATSSCVLEHSRRLAATIWEVTGIPSNPADFL